jgi:hypothetical protein
MDVKLTRKDFLKTGLAAAGAVVGIGGTACGGDDDGGGGGGGNSSCTTDITSNHGHSMSVAPADVDAGVAKTYTLSTANGHSHDVLVSPANFSTLKGGSSVSVTSSAAGDGHTHPITISC